MRLPLTFAVAVEREERCHMPALRYAIMIRYAINLLLLSDSIVERRVGAIRRWLDVITTSPRFHSRTTTTTPRH